MRFLAVFSFWVAVALSGCGGDALVTTTQAPDPDTPAAAPPGWAPHAPGVSDHADGSAGNPPSLRAYIGMGSTPTTGFDAHGVFGVSVKDGFVTVGTGQRKDGQEFLDGFVWKIGLCSEYPQTNVMVSTTPDRSSCGLQWVYRLSNAASNARKKSNQLLWAAESPDGTYIVAVGIVWTPTDGYDRYVVKLDALTGHEVWNLTMPDSSHGKAGGFESVTFAQDGGLVVSGFTNSDETEFAFKSSGQVESGTPVLVKFSAGSAASTSPPDQPQWTYLGPSGDAYAGSAKVVRQAEDGSLTALVGTGTALVKVDADGQEVWTNAYDSPSQGTDFAFVPDGLMVTGLKQWQSADVCPKGCSYNTGELVFISSDGQGVKFALSYGNPPGGQYQFAGLDAGPLELIYTECWGIQATKDEQGVVNGVVTACGTGIEECGTPGLTRALVEQCKQDPRKVWRSQTTGFNLQGEITWRRVDNFKGDQPTVDTSANEYVLLQSNGAPVAITDEGFGVGWEVMEWTSTGSASVSV